MFAEQMSTCEVCHTSVRLAVLLCDNTRQVEQQQHADLWACVRPEEQALAV